MNGTTVFNQLESASRGKDMLQQMCSNSRHIQIQTNTSV